MGYYVDKELYHHGIKGQRWGVRRFQNYDGTRISKGSEPATSPVAKKGLTDEQKKALKIAAGVTAGLLVAYGGYKLATSPKAKALATNVLYGNKDKRLADLDKEIANMGPEIVKKSGFGGLDSIEDFQRLDKDYLQLSAVERDNVVKQLNPEGGRHNCMACATSYGIMRRLGAVIGIRADVDTSKYFSDSLDMSAEGNTFMKKIFKDYVRFNVAPPVDSCAELAGILKAKCGTGDEVYGSLNLKPTNGGAHTVAFYMKNGEPRIVESQFGMDLSVRGFDQNFGKHIDWDQVGYLRTDNMELADGAIEFMKSLSTKS